LTNDDSLTIDDWGLRHSIGDCSIGALLHL
jgi:hypothetical protein